MTKLLFRFSGFSVVGAISTIVSIGLLYFLNDLIYIDVFIAYVLTYMTTICLSYFLNSQFVFKVELNLTACFFYLLTYISGMLLGVFLLKLANHFLNEWNDTIKSVMVIPFTMIWNFIFVNYILTKEKTNE